MSDETRPLTRRQRNRIARTRQILDTAMRLLVDEGLEALTTHRLARELDWAVGALYRYFSSKDALFATLVIEVIRDYGRAFTAMNEAADSYVSGQSEAVSILFKIMLVGRTYREGYLSSPPRAQLMNLTMMEPRTMLPEVEGKMVSDETVALLTAMSRLFSQAQQLGALSETPLMDQTILFWSALHGVLLRQRQGTRFEPELMNIERLSREMVLTLLRGWGAKADELESATTLLDGFPSPQLG